jgi:hypothetical protein
VPERIAPALLMLALLALVGCKGTATVPTTSPTPTVAPTSAGSSTAGPAPTSTGASTSVSTLPTGKPSPKPPADATPASTEGGTYANQVSISEDGALSFVPLRWYTGMNAEARCRAKGIKPEGAWCGDYYYEKAGGRQAAALDEKTKVRLLNDDLKPVDANLTQLVDAVEADVWPNFQIVVADGRVSRISQVFTP